MEILSTLSDVMREYFLPTIQEITFNEVDLIGDLERTSEDIQGGKYIHSALQTAYNERGIGARTELGTLPTAGQNAYDHFDAYIKYLYGTMTLSGPALKMAKKPNTLVDELARAMEGTMNPFKFDSNRQVWGDGNGFMAIGGTLSGSVLPVDKVYLFRPGMYIQSFTSAGSAGITSAYITDVDYVNKTITLSATTSYTTGDYIVRSGNVSYSGGWTSNEIMGITGIVSNANTTFQGIDPTNKQWWKSVVHTAGSNRALSIGLIEAALDEHRIICGETIEKLYVSPGVRRAFAHMMYAKSIPTEVISTKTGYGKGLKYNFNGEDIPLIASPHAPANSFYGVNTKYLKLFEAAPLEWEKIDGKLLHPDKDTDTLWARLGWYVQLCTTNRQKHMALLKITEA